MSSGKGIDLLTMHMQTSEIPISAQTSIQLGLFVDYIVFFNYITSVELELMHTETFGKSFNSQILV